MSIQAVAWALEQTIDDAGAKLVLVALANHADHKTGRAFPTVETLCHEASQSRRTVQGKLSWLERKRFLRVLSDHDPKTGRQRANSYFLRLGMASDDTVTLEEAESVALQGIQKGEGAEFAPSLFDEGGGCEPLHGEGATVCTGEGANCCTPIETVRLQPSVEQSDSRLNPPDGRTKIFFDPLKKAPILAAVSQALATIDVGQNAVITHDQGEAALKAAGFAVEREVFISDRGDGRRGRIDLVARKGTATIGIELDNESVRAKSLLKLACIGQLAGKGEGYRVAVLRKGVADTCPAGLDALVVLEPPKALPSGFWIAEEDSRWLEWCKANNHAPTLVSASREHGGRKGWVFRNAPPPAESRAA